MGQPVIALSLCCAQSIRRDTITVIVINVKIICSIVEVKFSAADVTSKSKAYIQCNAIAGSNLRAVQLKDSNSGGVKPV